MKMHKSNQFNYYLHGKRKTYLNSMSIRFLFNLKTLQVNCILICVTFAVLLRALPATFQFVEVSVADTPDLTRPPFLLTSPGKYVYLFILGRSTTIIEK